MPSPLTLDDLCGPTGPFADDQETRAALAGLGSDPDVIASFAAAVADLLWMEITGPAGAAAFERETVEDRWRVAP